ncbi:unnamed protein product [Musa acuminata subsp. malaccensis]|uniref:(wild Malaysian banana) hypothetical protein n=1 Tax=Musa acuminata subsp. malaccensis TaxID=214687 RepID=A0A804IXK7_MUSAM|nr:unnamed protein product [Musa acuminata subsp. malaccensis]
MRERRKRGGQEELAVDKEKRERNDSLNLLLNFLLIVILNPLSTLFGTLLRTMTMMRKCDTHYQTL